MADKEVSQESSKNVDVTEGRGHQRVNISTGKIILNNLLGGIAWGFGTVLGATIIAALVVLIFSKLNSLPIIGDFFSNILRTVQQGAK